MAFDDDADLVYTERLTPSALAWLLAPGFGLVFFLMFFPTSVPVAAAIGVISGILAGIWLWTLSSPIRLSPRTLRAGPARIEISNLGTARALDAAQMRHELGPGSDARSFVITRPWVRGGIMIDQLDPRDPTPSWIFSSRRPEEFVAALQEVRQRG